MLHLPISQLAISPGTKVRARLLKSIQEKGILTPILVERNGAGYKILDGRRRVAAAIQLGLEKVPAVLVEGGGPEITLLAHGTRSENPVAELEAICELQRRGLSEKEIAHAGYSSISRIRRLAKLNGWRQNWLRRLQMGKSHPAWPSRSPACPRKSSASSWQTTRKSQPALSARQSMPTVRR